MIARPLAYALAGLVAGAAFPAAAVAMGATGALTGLLLGLPVLLALLGYLLGRQAEAIAEFETGARREARARRDESERAAAEILQRSRTLATAVAALTASTDETATVVRATGETVERLSGSATASALTAEGVVGLALESERAAARGLAIAERSRDALTRLAAEVHALSSLVGGLETRTGDLLSGAETLSRVAERSRALSSLARLQAEGGMLAPEALPALAARMDGHAAEAVEAAARARALLGEMHAELAAAVRSAEAGSVRAGEGAMVLEGAAGSIRELASALSASAASGREIARVAQLQDAGVEAIREAMNGIFLACERSSASTREVADEARALGELAARLRRAPRIDQ
ncbi:MAG TPA: hypothetical protein VFM53_14700 [Anaeromyxobacteraceae bacterium]|nr:hypothetical protein [Anaeromyxobacteraceae bacterium]